MSSRFKKQFQSLELEEKILNAGSLVALVGTFLPWLSGEWLGTDRATYGGFGFFTSFMGITIFLLHFFILLLTVFPLLGGPVLIRRRYREWVRTFAAAQAVILSLAVLSVLLNITLEFSRMQIRFGLYITLVGSGVTLLYALLRLNEHRHADAHDVFSHPDTPGLMVERRENMHTTPPPPPPPPAPEPEEHRIYPFDQHQ